MTIKITLEQLFDAHPAFQLLGKQFFYLNKIVEARDLFEQVNAQYALIAKKQTELLEFYGKKQESGVYDVADDKKPFFEKELSEFLATEIEINWSPVDVNQLGDIQLPIPAYELLKFLFLESAAQIEEVQAVS